MTGPADLAWSNFPDGTGTLGWQFGPGTRTFPGEEFKALDPIKTPHTNMLYFQLPGAERRRDSPKDYKTLTTLKLMDFLLKLSVV